MLNQPVKLALPVTAVAAGALPAGGLFGRVVVDDEPSVVVVLPGTLVVVVTVTTGPVVVVA